MKTVGLYAKIRKRKKSGRQFSKMRRLLALSKKTTCREDLREETAFTNA